MQHEALDFPIKGYGAMRIFAGQPDALDPSHFTLEFEVGDKHDSLDAWLHSDDTLSISVRNASPDG